METDLILLIVATIIKVVVISLMTKFLFQKWQNQRVKYFTDFPFLMGVNLSGFIITKLYDIWAYIYYYFNPTGIEEMNQTSHLGLKFRSIIMVILVLLPLLTLLVMIWFSDKNKIQYSIVLSWTIFGVLYISLTQEYSAYMFAITLLSVPILVGICITFGVAYFQKKLPELQSLWISVGFLLYFAFQIIRPIWVTIGTGVWGLTWIAEILEMFSLVLITRGFMVTAPFHRSRMASNHDHEFSLSEELEVSNF